MSKLGVAAATGIGGAGMAGIYGAHVLGSVSRDIGTTPTEFEQQNSNNRMEGIA